MSDKIPNMRADYYQSSGAFNEGLVEQKAAGFRLLSFQISSYDDTSMDIVAVFEEVPK